MGNTRSEFFESVSDDLWWKDNSNNFDSGASASARISKCKRRGNKMSGDRADEISTLHEKRLKLISEKKKEINDLREELARQKNENWELREFLKESQTVTLFKKSPEKSTVDTQTDTFEVPGTCRCSEYEAVRKKNMELQIDIAKLQKDLQSANSEILTFANERKEYNTHVFALKDIIAVSKQLLLMREGQVKELTKKVEEIQSTLSEKELQNFSENLSNEYERQLQNIKQLRNLYEERQRMDKAENEKLKTQLEEATNDLKTQEDKNKELQARVDELENENWNKYDTINNLESQLGFSKAECSELKAEMSAINQLFSQILMGFNSGQEIDLDKLIKSLEENHDLLTDIVINEESNAASSALPKVLLDLVNQVNDKSKETSCQAGTTLPTITEGKESQTPALQNSLSSASEIVQNLPKVWKILAELLSHQTGPVQNNDDPNDKDPCYKSVQTPTGSVMVLSVSKTYIRLKNLILEKKSLQKETSQLKQLNSHLEVRLQDQEKRLELVSHELSKTWHVVGKMQKQHQQLHTQEKILRYELAQKRKLLNELKEELEYCREKWIQAREKNSTTEEQWKQLRIEFSMRKKTNSEDLNNSIESGYSDERESSSSDEDDNLRRIPGTSDLGSKDAEDVTVGQSAEPKDPTILKVIKDEIANIESSMQSTSGTNNKIIKRLRRSLSLPSGSSLNVPEENSDIEYLDLHTLNRDVLNYTERGIDEVHSKQTLKTELVQNQEVQKDENSFSQIKLVSKSTSTSNGCVTLCAENESSSENRRKDIDDMYKKLEEDILFTIEKTKNCDEYPSTSKHIPRTQDTESGKDETLQEQLDQSVNELPSTSGFVDLSQSHGECSNQTDVINPSSSLSTEEIFARRELRLQRMEEQAQQLVKGAMRNSWRGMEFYRKLTKLHERFRNSSDSSDDDTNYTTEDTTEPADNNLDDDENVKEDDKEEE